MGFSEWWLLGRWEYADTGNNGVQIGCLLMRELRHIERENETKVIVFPQYAQIDIEKKPPRLVDVLECARTEGLTVVDP